MPQNWLLLRVTEPSGIDGIAGLIMLSVTSPVVPSPSFMKKMPPAKLYVPEPVTVSEKSTLRGVLSSLDSAPVLGPFT
jgi:hypothetical protein